MGNKKLAWLIALNLVMLAWPANGQQPPEWTQNADPSRYLLTAAEMPQQQAIPGEIQISEPTYSSDFAEKDYRNPSGKLNWWFKIRQDFTSTADAGKQAQVTIMVFENALHAGYSWRLTNRPTGEDTRSAIDDFYKNAGAGVPRSHGGWHLAGNLWIAVGGNWNEFRDAYLEALLAKHGRTTEERSIEVTAYDGSDHRHLPLTFWIIVNEHGKPVANEPVRLEFVGEARCLADRWAWWDSTARQWREVGDVNLALTAVEGSDAPQTDADGRVIIRVFLDFWRIRNMQLPLPHRVGLKASVESGNAADPKRVTDGATMVVRHGAFIRALYYSAPNGPLVPLAVLEQGQSRNLDIPDSLHERWTRPGPQEDVRREGVHHRVTIGREKLPEDVVFERPDFYVGVPSPEAQLFIDARPDEEPRSRSYLPTGSGIGVHMLWLDGSEGIFMVHAPGVLDAIISGVPNRSMTVGNQSLSHAVYFVVGQGVDVLVKTAVVGAATALGGPVAGGYAFVIVQSGMTAKDIYEAHNGYNLSNGHIVMIRSEVAITSPEQGSPVLHVFEGSPGVVGADGNETVVTGGQSLDLLPKGAVGEVRRAGPNERATAMHDALQTMGPPTPGRRFASIEAQKQSGGGCIVAFVIALLLGGTCAVGAGAFVLWRRHSGRRTGAPLLESVPPSLPPAAVTTPPPLPPPPGGIHPPPQSERAAAPAALPVLILEQASGEGAGQTVTFSGPTRVGRAVNNDFRLEDKTVSGSQASLTPDGSLWIVTDLGSANGTWVDGRRIDGPCELTDGAALAFGRCRFRISFDTGAVIKSRRAR